MANRNNQPLFHNRWLTVNKVVIFLLGPPSF
nr:MAG TPA: hypothetical protein [Caudoviricetes sp.]